MKSFRPEDKQSSSRPEENKQSSSLTAILGLGLRREAIRQNLTLATQDAAAINTTLLTLSPDALTQNASATTAADIAVIIPRPLADGAAKVSSFDGIIAPCTAASKGFKK